MTSMCTSLNNTPYHHTIKTYLSDPQAALPEDEELGGHGQGIKKVRFQGFDSFMDDVLIRMQLLGLPADMVLGKPSEVAELVAFLIKPGFARRRHRRPVMGA